MIESADEARRAGGLLGYPVACKTARPARCTNLTSTAYGLVGDEGAARRVSAIWRALGPRALIAQMARRGVELSLGMIRDPQFGPVVTVGAGGVLVELLDDRQRRTGAVRARRPRGG